VIAGREYRAAVRTKAFVVTLVLMPVLMLGSVGLQVVFKRLEDTREKKIAVVDRSGGKVAAALKADEEFYNQFLTADPTTGTRSAPAIKLEVVPPSPDDPAAVLRQRLELSQRVERDDLDAVVEIGADVFRLRAEPNPELAADGQAIRWQTKKPGEGLVGRWLDRRANEAVQRERFTAIGYDADKVRGLQQPVPVRPKGLTRENRATGAIEDAADERRLVNFFLPGILIALMFMVIMVGATPAMQGIVEEKGQRIAEVLLGSVTPFELMAGKLLGVVAVSLTLAAVYFAGGYVSAARYGLTELITPGLMLWFGVFLVLALLLYGSLFIAVGAAAGDIKDTQTMLTPIMVLACLPFFALSAILSDPNGPVAVGASFWPFGAPMVLVARESVPPGVPPWQMATGIAITLATTVLCVWAAGRIFRVGILMQGKGARTSDLLRWIVKG
ncbi:MAG TPA: ABC transporter permease, partial [Gemmataceae bacterium]|nr:ABC transporter permease [Gemmataceae bacterium]